MADIQGGAQQINGSTPHDDADSGNPVKIGGKAVEYNVDPPIVSADDDRTDAIFTPQGMQWVLGGHPNIINREFVATGVNTNIAISDAVAAGSQVVVTALSVMLDNSSSADVGVRIGFAAATLPTTPTDGNNADRMLLSHPGIAAGSGVVMGNGGAAIGLGADGEELRITCETPTPGSLRVTVSYYVSAL